MSRMAAAGDGVEIQLRLGGDFAADDDEVGLGVGFAGDAAELVLREAGVQDVIRNGVADLVGMALADRLRRKDEIFAHNNFTGVPWLSMTY